ncbi:MAG: hypothetical protein HUU21_31100 [Polyangiaceae bacterium]|nr:hypothetical protein [Polyangiaceae bacterium]
MMSSRLRRKTAAEWSLFLVVLLSVLGLSLAAGCSKSIESPELKASTGPGSVVPDLVCIGQMTTNVVITGSGFAPIPTKTVSGPKTELVLPKIELKPVSSLDDMAPATAVQIPDDPANPGESNVHYLSDTSMSFDIDESLNLEGGVYDIVATNPDGAHAATWPASLVLIPPPEITELVPPAVCDDQTDQSLTLNGRFFLKVDDKLPTVTINGQVFTVTEMSGCTAVTANIVEKVEICSSITITIPVMALGPGEFDVIVTNPGTAGCVSTSEIKVKINPPPRVDAVVPQNVCSGGSLLTISGQNFLTGADGAMPRVELRLMGQMPIVATGVEMSQPGTELKATFGPGPTAGTTYDVVVVNSDGCEDRPLPHKQVNGVEGPILFFVDPPVVSNAINTRVTLFATVINKPLPMSAVSITPAGQMMPVTVLKHNDVVGYPKRLQAEVPAGLPPGSYDVHLDDASECSAAVLPGGLTIAADQNLTVARVEPPFGDSAAAVPITIFRDTAAPAPADMPFAATPSVFLNPAASQNPPPDAVGIEVSFVTLIDPDTLTAVVPANTPVGLYDVVVVNPEGTVGILKDGYNSLMAPPPVIESVTPPSVAASSGQIVVVEGSDFRPDALISLTCVDAMGAPTAAPPVTQTQPVCDANGKNCSMAATIDATVLGAGSVCVLRVTNADMSFGDFSAIGVTTPSLNLETPKPGTPMNVARRGLVSAAVKATTAARFVFAVAGDDGIGMVFDSVEAAPVDLYGKMGSWAVQRYNLTTPRVFAGGASSGRYIYVGGGRDGMMNDLASVERAMLLSPAEAPVVADVDLTLGDVGLEAGQWFYRVSAVFDAADPENPGGESLASDEFVIKLPAIPNKKIAVILTWTEPKDMLGNPLPGVAGYRIYRTPMVNGTSFGEVLLAEVQGAATLKYTDDGTATPGTDTPLPLGSTGAWTKLPDLAVPRNGASFAIGPDPDSPDTKLYLYAIFGKNGNALQNDYEYLSIDVGANGHHTVAPAWTTGAATGAGRYNHGAWIVDRAIKAEVGQMPNDPDTTFIYVGGGQNLAGGFVNDVNRARVQPGGELDAFAFAGKNVTGGWAGYGVLAAAGQLFLFGGDQAQPATKGISGQIIDSAGTLANNSWNAGLSLATPRAFMGSSVQSAFAFFIGGTTDVDAASTSTELVVW